MFHSTETRAILRASEAQKSIAMTCSTLLATAALAEIGLNSPVARYGCLAHRVALAVSVAAGVASAMHTNQGELETQALGKRLG